MSGTADLTLQQAVQLLRDAGHADLAAKIDDVLVGRDVMACRWTFQLVEDYDANYWQVSAPWRRRRVSAWEQRSRISSRLK